MNLKNCIPNLAQFHKIYPDGFKSITVDITGFCNAKCKYCPSGNDLSHKGQFMSLEMYEHILQKLLDYHFLTNSTAFHIYGLGEPLLNPQLEEVLCITGRYGIKTNISTNASVIPKIIDRTALQAVARILISMPGFSQSSQNKIHGFSFERVKANILKLREMLPDIPFDMSYHIYQFNLDEIDLARQFCIENDIKFSPNYAVLFDRNKCLDYVNNRLSYEELKQITSELLIHALDHQIQSASKFYCDFINRYLSINVDGNVRVCNSFTKSYEKNILCGNILYDSADEILSRKYSQPFCVDCMAAGLTFTEGYDCKVFPDFYYSLMRENEFLWNNFDCQTTSILEKINFMHRVRFWEQKHFSSEALEPVLDILKDGSLTQKDVHDIICHYARFKDETYRRLHVYLNKENT